MVHSTYNEGEYLMKTEQMKHHVGMSDVIAFLLAGGRGQRLMPLTNNRAKPAVPFGGKWYIIDPALYSLYYSGIETIKVLTQFSSQPLIQHVQKSWPRKPNDDLYVDVIPAQQQLGSDWYTGTANAVWQNYDLVCQNICYEIVAIFAGDHIFKFDVTQMREFHDDNEADFTICAKEVPVAEAAKRFGVIVVDEKNRVIDFQEKPDHPAEIPGKPGYCYASMGNYLANARVLRDVLFRDSLDPESGHDFGHDIIPAMVKDGLGVYVYNFDDNKVRDQKAPYWVDVGTIASYHQANMDLAGEDPALNLYSPRWAIMTPPDNAPPAKVARKSSVEYCIFSGGDILDGAEVYHSVFGRRVVANFGSLVEQSILFDDVKVGNNARLCRTIVCEDVVIPPETHIGYDLEVDIARGIIIDEESQIRIIPRGFRFPE